jgi:hypothetical protein
MHNGSTPDRRRIVGIVMDTDEAYTQESCVLRRFRAPDAKKDGGLGHQCVRRDRWRIRRRRLRVSRAGSRERPLHGPRVPRA